MFLYMYGMSTCLDKGDNHEFTLRSGCAIWPPANTFTKSSPIYKGSAGEGTNTPTPQTLPPYVPRGVCR